MAYGDLVEDGHIPGLLVHPDWYEPRHPQELPVDASDSVALWHPAPELSEDGGVGVDVLTGVWSPAPVNETLDEGNETVTLYTFTAAGGYPGYTYQYQLIGSSNIQLVIVSATTLRLKAIVSPLGDTEYTVTVVGTVTDDLGQQVTDTFDVTLDVLEPTIPAGLILFSDNGINNTRPGWEAVDKVTGLITHLAPVFGSVAQITSGTRWQPSGNYVSTAYSTTQPRVAIFKRTGDTAALSRLTAGVPAWSSFKTCTAWDGDNRLIAVGEVSLYCEVASRSGDTFSLISTPLSLQHLSNNFGCDVLNGSLIVCGNDVGGVHIRTYLWNGSNQYVLANSYGLGASSVANNVRISPDGLWVAVFGIGAASAGILRVYSRAGEALTQVHANLLTGTSGAGSKVVFSRDSQFLYMQSATGTTTALQGWKNISGTWTPIALGVAPSLAGAGVSVSPNNALLAIGASGANRHTIYGIDQSSGALTQLDTSDWANNVGSDLAFSDNENLNGNDPLPPTLAAYIAFLNPDHHWKFDEAIGFLPDTLNDTGSVGNVDMTVIAPTSAQYAQPGPDILDSTKSADFTTGAIADIKDNFTSPGMGSAAVGSFIFFVRRSAGFADITSSNLFVTDSSPVTAQLVFAIGSTAPSRRPEFRHTPTPGNSVSYYPTTDSLTTNDTWQCIVFSQANDGTGPKIYINGNPMTLTTSVQGTGGSANAWFSSVGPRCAFSAGNADTGQIFRIRIGSVFTLDRVITQQEVTNLMSYLATP
jgi:hypothetical protein